MPLPRWVWRFVYDRESTIWVRRRDEPEHRELIDRIADRMSQLIEPPGPVADLGCGPGAHARALARRGYDVIGLDGSPRMVQVARERTSRDAVEVTFDVADVRRPLPFPDRSLGGALAILLIQHLPDPASLVAEIHRCLRPGGYLLLSAPSRDVAPLTMPTLHWRLRAAVARLPGMISFFDVDSLRTLVESRGFSVIEHDDRVGGVSVIARA